MRLLPDKPFGRELDKLRGWPWAARSLFLVMLSSFCLLKYLGWSWLFSGIYGVPSQAAAALAAHRKGSAYFWALLLAEAFLVANLISGFRFTSLELDGFLKVFVRVVAAVVTAGIGTLIAAFLLNSVGRLIS